MDTSFFSYVFDHAGNQLKQVFAGMDEDTFDSQSCGIDMTPRQSAIHLTEAYIAGTKHLNDESHEWGSYKGLDDTQSALVETLFAERQNFKDAAIANGDEKALKAAHDYGSAHDYYHVGQLVTVRRSTEPEWDSYAIYNEG